MAGDTGAGVEAEVEAIPIPSAIFIPGYLGDGGLMAQGHTRKQYRHTTQHIDFPNGGSH